MRLLWISGIDGFCHRYEVLHRVAQARLLGVDGTVRHFTDVRLTRDVTRADAVIAYRTPETPLVRAVLAGARERSLPVIGTIDDLIFVPEEDALPPFERLTAAERELWRDGVRRYRAVLDACDGFIAPTEPLLHAARELGWRAWLHRDALSAAELSLGNEARRGRRARAEAAVVLGYFSGTPTHDRDLASIAPVLAEVLRGHPEAVLLIVGPLVLDDVLESFGARIRRLPLMPWTELPAVIAGVDVCLAPLEPDRAFAAAKGEVKYLEAAAVAVPTIASTTPAFRHAIGDGRTGRLAGHPDEWRHAIEELIASPDLRRELGEAARADVEARFSPEPRAGELRTILLDALSAGGGARPTARAASRADTAVSVASHDGPRVALEPDGPPVVLWPATAEVSPPLASGSVLAQHFVVARGSARRIDVRTVTYGQRLTGVLRLRVLDEAGRVVVRRRRRVTCAPDRAWWSFAIPAGRLTAGRWHRLELSCEVPHGGGTLSFALGPAGTGRNDARASTRVAAELDGVGLGAALALRIFSTWQAEASFRECLDRARTLPAALRAVAQAEGPRRRVVFVARDGSEQRLALATLLARAGRIARDLATRGVGAGDAVVLVLPTGPELVAVYLATLLLGALPALASTPTQRVTDPATYRELLRGIARDAGARVVYCDERTAAVLAPGGGAAFCGASLVVRAGGARTACALPLLADDPEAVATIQYSSGSTGRPKGARLSHRAILNNVRAVRDGLEIGPGDVSVNWIPLYHDMGLIDALLLPLLCGCETVLLPTADFVREPRLWLAALTRYGGTISWAPNFAYALCVQRVDAHARAGLDLSRWRLAINAAEPVLPETIAAFASRFAPVGFRPEAMTPAWGLAENVTIATVHPPALAPRVARIDRAAAAAGCARAVRDGDAGFGCVAVGRPLPGCAVEIRDGDRTLGECCIGDVWLRSDSLYSGYANGETGTRGGSEGWLATGDRGYLADGDLFFVARARDVIVIAGEKFAPHDVEAAINEVPGVRAGCAVAFGVRDGQRGTEALAAVVETRLSARDDLAALSRAIQTHVTRVTGLALRHLKLVPPGGVCKTTSGKLARAATHASYASELA